MILDDIRLRQSRDSAKQDLEVTCDQCGEHLCDAEANDNLGVLVAVALSHGRKKHTDG